MAENEIYIFDKQSPNYSKNQDRAGSDAYGCVICGKPVTTKKPKMLWIHQGGSHAVTKERAEELNASGQEGADLGYQPIGNNCLREHPELKPFVMKDE